MTKVSLSLLFVLCVFFSFGQSDYSSELLKLLDEQKSTEKVQTLNQLSEFYLSKDSDQAKSFAQQALETAMSIDDLEGAAQAHENLGLALLSKFDNDGAMASFFECLSIRTEHNDEVGQMTSRTHIGFVFSQMNEYVQAEENFVKALEIALKIEDMTGAASAYEGLGEVYLEKKIFGKSLEQYEQALQLRLATEQFQEASKIATKLGDISASLANYESAINYFQTSLHLYQELNNQSQIARLQSKISTSFLGQKMADETIRYSQDALAIFQTINDSVGMAECFKNIGLAHVLNNDYSSARTNLSLGSSILKSTQVTPDVPPIFQEIAGAFAKMGNASDAYQAQLDYSKSRDTKFDQEKNKALMEMTTMYESKFEANEQRAQIEILKVENETSRKISYFLFAMLGLIGLLLTNLFISYRRKQKDNQLLEEKNEENIKQRNEIDLKNQELEAKNISLDLLNKKLIDEIAERENIEKSSFARDRFLATMSHEMRTPLNVIIGLTHILLESSPRKDQVEQLRTLQFSANDLVVFINDVLDFSKIEAGKLNLEDRPFKPAKVLNEVRARFEEKADETGILFNFFQDTQVPESMLGDDARFMQIMSNILTDTFQHTSEGFVKVDVSLYELKAQKAWIRIVVEGSDGGVKRSVFEDVSLSDFDEKEEPTLYQGSQFSLTITKRLVELQNGNLTIEIDEGKSTAFVVMLPFKVVSFDSKLESRKTKTNSVDLNGLNILVVEDNKINQLVVAKMLKKTGAEVDTANNGLEALELFDHKNYELILMDIQMPVMDGYRATAEIRRHPDEGKRDIPIIALTASAFLTEKEKAVLFGMNDHVGKPFSPDELLEKIQNCLAVYRSA